MPRVDLSLAGLRIRKLLFALGNPLCRRALLLGIAASVEHAEALAGKKYGLVIDVGANKGQFALFSRTHFPDARIICFEPQAGPAGRLGRLFSEHVAKGNGVVIRPFALGEASGVVAMHVAARDDSSSLLEIGHRETEAFGTREVGQVQVDVRRLDEVLSEQQILRPALLKIDVEGYETSVLRGCGQLLEQFDDVYVEASYLELHRNQALASDVIALLHRAGFQLCGVFNQRCDTDGAPLQADFLFRRGATGG